MKIVFLIPDLNKITGQSYVSSLVSDIIRPGKIIYINSFNISTLKKIFQFANCRPHLLYITLSRSFVGSFRDYILLSLIRPIKVISHIHGMGFKEKKYFQNKNIARSDELILLTKKSILDFKYTYQDFKGNIVCIENPISKQIDRNIIRDDEIENINIYFFSNIMASKGIIEFLKLSYIHNQKYNFNIAGRNLDKLDFKNYNVNYKGVLTGNEKWDFLNNNHVHIFLSSYKEEFYPISIIESIYFGNLCIVKRHNDLEHTFKNLNILWVDNLSQVNTILDDKDKLIKLWRQNVSWFMKNKHLIEDRFSHERFRKSIIKIFQI